MQNVDILIEAAKLMKEDKNVWFHIIGNGVYKEKLEVKARKYGIINISFWPMQPPESAPVIYSAADVNVIPLVKDVYRTALPSKTATCMACGKPIIFAIGKESKFGQIDIKKDGYTIVNSDDAQELANEIKSLMQKRNNSVSTRFYCKNMSKTKNSRLYANIITKHE